MTPFSLSGLLTAVAAIPFGIFVLIFSPTKKIGKNWFLFSISVGMYGLGALWIGSTKTPEEALLAWRLAYGETTIA